MTSCKADDDEINNFLLASHSTRPAVETLSLEQPEAPSKESFVWRGTWDLGRLPVFLSIHEQRPVPERSCWLD